MRLTEKKLADYAIDRVVKVKVKVKVWTLAIAPLTRVDS